MSKEHKMFIKKEKRKKTLIKISQLLLLITFLIMWEILTKYKIIDSFITSSPSNILKTLIELYNKNNLFIHINTTIKELLLSFTITTLLSFIIALILYTNETLYKILDPYLTILNSLPKVALGPLIIIYLGANSKSIITMSILISIILSTQNILNGFKNTSKSKIKYLQTLNASKKDILTKLVIPSNKYTIMNSLKINISMCLIGTIQGEFLTSKSGIGYLIMYGTQVFNLNLVMTAIILLTIISYILYLIINNIK